MTAYKDEKRGTWFVNFRYKDWGASPKGRPGGVSEHAAMRFGGSATSRRRWAGQIHDFRCRLRRVYGGQRAPAA